MTTAEHVAQRALVQAALLLAPSRTERHGIYALRNPRPRLVPPRAPQIRDPRK